MHVGNVLVDVVLSVPALPAAGGDVLARAGGLAVGAGYNVLVAARRQGMPAGYGGTLGTGPLGDLCRAALADAGIEVWQPPVTDRDTGFTVALVDGDGERTFVTSPGAEADLTPEHLASLEIHPTDHVYVSGYALAHNGRALVPWLSDVDGTVIVDPGPLAEQVPDAVRDRVDWWSCSAAELRLPGRLGTVVRLGARGCEVTVTGDRPVRVPGFDVDAVDTNGAGDAHVGTFVAALARGLDPAAAARRANAAAALAVTRPGPATAPTAAEVDVLLGERG